MNYILAPESSDKSGAVISECGAYRYLLWRKWGGAWDGFLLFIMLNPSKADATEDDHTLRRCIEFAKREGLGGVRVVNLFAYRSTDPSALRRVPDPIGQYNDDFIQAQISSYRPTVVAWGDGALRFQERVWQVLDIVHAQGSACCLGTTKNGAPRHPLRLQKDTPFVSFPL